MADQLRDLRVGLDQRIVEIQRMGRREADAVDAVDGGDVVDQQRQVRRRAVVHGTGVAVDVLPQQGDLAHALLGELRALAEDVLERARDLLTAGVGHHAEAAVLAAALHDRDEGGRPLGPGLGQAVELLDLREADVHHRALRPARAVHHIRQTVQGLGPEDHVHVGRALGDGRALLARHAAADADHQPRALGLERLPAPELREHLLLRLLAHGAGVEQDEVRLLGGTHALVAALGTEHLRHLRGVVLVHLTAVGVYVNLGRHKPRH